MNDAQLAYLIGSLIVAVIGIGVVVYQKLRLQHAYEVDGNVYRTGVIRELRKTLEEKEKVIKSQAQLLKDKSAIITALYNDLETVQKAATTIQETLDGI